MVVDNISISCRNFSQVVMMPSHYAIMMAVFYEV